MDGFRRRDVLVLSGQTLALALLAGCARGTPAPSPTPQLPLAGAPPSRTPAAQPTLTPMPTPSPTTPGVSLDAKIGQMLMLGFRGYSLAPADPIVADIRERNAGSVVLFNYDTILKAFTRNVESPAQLQALDRALQGLASTPLLISIDQEGGMVSRLTENNGFPTTQSQAFYGAKNDPALTRAAAEAQGLVLKNAGINLNLAPVVDLALNPNNTVIVKNQRSFSADPKIVTANAIAAIEGYHAQGILTTLKHFPGHGSSTADSHLGFVDVTNMWQESELEPYREIIKAGLADAIMTAHIFNGNLDPKYPATLSKAILTGILREQLAYDGVVITDDMQMGAIRQYYGFEQAIELAIDAGADILAFANNTVFDAEIGTRAFLVVKQLVSDGKISERRIDESYQRVMRLKARIQR